MKKHPFLPILTCLGLTILSLTTSFLSLQHLSHLNATSFQAKQPALQIEMTHRRIPGLTLTPAQVTRQATTTSLVILDEPFETSWPANPLWQVLGNPQWGRTDAFAAQGDWSLFMAKNGSLGIEPFTPYPNDFSTTAAYGPFDLSDGLPAELTFACWLDSEPAKDPFFFGVSDDGLNFYGKQVSGFTHGWVSETLDLSRIPPNVDLTGGKRTWLAFQFTSNYRYPYQGVFVDNVRLEKTNRGLVYKPNPIMTTGDMTLQDNNNADSQRLTEALELGGLGGLLGSPFLQGSM